MLAKHSIRVLLSLVIALAPFALAGCGDSKSGGTPTDATGTNPDLLKNYPTKGAKAPD